MKYTIATLICLILFYTLPATATDFRFRHYTVENGLPSNSVRAILQDRYGYLWFGTDDGLCRYDGIAPKTYRRTPNNQGLGSNYISSLFEEENQLLVGTDNGLYIYSYKTDSFSPFDKRTAKGEKLETTINHITKDRDNNLWFATNGQGVYKYNKAHNLLERYDFSGCLDFIPQVLVDSENRIWAVTNQGKQHIYRLNKVSNKFEPFSTVYEDPEHNARAITIFQDSDRNMWLGTWECGLHKIDPYSGKVTIYLHPSDGKGVMHIHSIAEYAPHQLMIGSDDGLSLFDTTTGEHTLFTYDEINPYSLSNRFVYPIFKDHEGGIWIGTYYGGVNYLSPNTGQFEGHSPSRFSNSVSGSIIGGFCEDNNGNVWIASDDGGLNRFNPATRHFTHYLPQGKQNSLSYHNVHALCLDGNDLWIGTYTGNVNILDIPTGRFRQYPSLQSNPNTLDGTSSYAIFKDRAQQIWVATMTGINRYNRKNDNFERIKETSILTIDIDQDTKGNIWFSTLGKGIYKYTPEKNSWKHYQLDGIPGCIISNQVNCTTIDADGQIWIGTMEGLCKYHPETDTFEVVSLDIPSQNICCIIEHQQVLWMTTAKGLVRYIPGERCQVFTKSDGLQSDQFLPNSGIITRNGKIYIGSVDGFNAFYPFNIRQNNVIPPVVITGLEIFNREIEVGDELLPYAFEETEQLELSHKDNVFSLRYASLSYCTPEKNQYAYKLEGFDKGWNYVGSQNKATYTNLPAGTYRFKVRATNNDGSWNEEGANLQIVIYPPFYLTTGFKILYFIIAVIALALFIRFLLRRSEKKHAVVIDQLHANKEKEVHEAKIKFFTMIAHEVRTPVSLIIGPLEKIRKSAALLPEPIRDSLEIIDRNSQRLLFLINQLLDFRKVEQEGLRIKCVSCNISQLLKAVCERFEPTIVQHNARFRVEYPEPNFVATVDSEALTKVISNLLTNAAKYTKDEVILTCKACQDVDQFILEVTDNGVGISEENRENIFKPFFQTPDNKPGTGLGLSIVKSIVDAHNGNIEVVSELGKGTSFVVTMPVSQPDNVSLSNEVSPVDVHIPEDILPSSAPTEETKHKPLLLIVDDNEEMLVFLSDSFADNYQTLTATDGKQALELLNNHDVTLIISDWMMPVMDGVEFCRAVRTNQLTSHIPFILLTAKTDLASKVEGMDCGADAYLEKPFSLEYLEACIKNLVELRGVLRQKFSQMPLVPLNSIAGNSADEKFLSRMNQIIEENFSNSELSVDFLAEQLCISRSGLFAKIKTLANITPNELIQLVRLKKAALLLQENQYRINEISYMVGFNNPSYFSKCFQKQFGMKPGEFITKSKNT